MRKLADWLAGLVLAALAVYLPVWWMLFLGGHFAPQVSPEVIALVTCFLPADAFALATGTCGSPTSGSRTRLHAFTHGTSCPSRHRRTSPKCLTFIGFVAGVWRRQSAWTCICGFAFCGSVVYFCLFAACAIISGAFPGDLVMHLAVWPYLAAAVLIAWRLHARFPSVTPEQTPWHP
jgi:hypothetical protein